MLSRGYELRSCEIVRFVYGAIVYSALSTLIVMKFSGNTVVVSSSGGAIIGGVFGPLGAIIGAVAGATVGLISSSQDDDGPNHPGKNTDRIKREAALLDRAESLAA